MKIELTILEKVVVRPSGPYHGVWGMGYGYGAWRMGLGDPKFGNAKR